MPTSITKILSTRYAHRAVGRPSRPSIAEFLLFVHTDKLQETSVLLMTDSPTPLYENNVV